MKKIILINAVFALLVLTACKKSVDFIGDNTTATGTGFIPVSTNPLIDLNNTPNRTLTATLGSSTPSYAGGTQLRVELQYFSQSPVKEISLFETVGSGSRNLVAMVPYTPAYSNIKRLDTLIVPYTIPTAVAANTGIKLEYEIVNQNALKLVRTGWVRKNP